MNKLLSIIFLIFGLLFLLNLGYSALPTGCTLSNNIINCTKIKTTINLDLDSNPNTIKEVKLASDPNSNTAIVNITNNNINNLKITIHTLSRTLKINLIGNNNLNVFIEDFSYSLKTITNVNKNFNITTLTLNESSTSLIDFNNISTIYTYFSGNQYASNTLVLKNTTQIDNFITTETSTGIKIIINTTNSPDLIINDFRITKQIFKLETNNSIKINNGFFANNDNINLNLFFDGGNYFNFNNLDINNIIDSNLNLFDFNLNTLNRFSINNSRNLIINGFDYNKINTLNLVSPNSMLNITNSQFVSIQGFKLYSDKGIKNNNLNYINLNNSLAIIKNNVFNDVNYPIKSYDSNVMIYSNSFYNVDNIFDTNLGNSSIVFFNNFLKAIDNLYNLTFAPEYILSLDENKSFGPVIDDVNYSCSEQKQPIFYDRFFDSTNLRDRNIPIYYYDPKTKTNINYIYAPQCLGGNLYANKTILNICGQNCFLFLMEYNNTDKPDLIWDLPLTAKYADNIIDNAPLIFPKVEYQDIIYETSDKYLQMAISIINKKDPYEKTDDVNFQILIRPNDLILKDNALEEFFFGGDKIYHFKSIDIENKKIILDKSVSANAFQEGCDICKKVNGSVIYSFEIVFEDLNFDLTNFDKLKSGDKNFKFSLNYDFDNNSSSCNWVEDYWDKYPYEKNDPELLDLYNNILFCSTQKQSISQLIPLNIEGSAPTIKTPDNNIWIIALLSISIVGIYLFGNRRQSKRKQSI